MEQEMRLTIFAATGGIGRQVLEQAVTAGHDVTAVVRNPNNVSAKVRVVTADLAAADPAVLESAAAWQGTRAIVQAMKAKNVRRIVVVSAAPIGTVPSPARPQPPKHDPGDGFFMRHLFSPLAKTALRKHYADLARMEDVLRESGLDWTVVRPPKLTDKPLTGTYRMAYGQNLRGGWDISRADVAHYMLRVLKQPETIKQVIGIAN